MIMIDDILLNISYLESLSPEPIVRDKHCSKSVLSEVVVWGQSQAVSVVRTMDTIFVFRRVNMNRTQF